uniref:GRF-type domain-containing protein n=1 Tax=Triticum urartu TaxID=4572 RepID=A0A8R7UG89_TRIUA
MSASSSSSGFEQLPPLVSCPQCGGRIFTWIARVGQNAGVRFYKCVNKDSGICNYMRTKEEYLAELSFHLGTTQQTGYGSSQAGSVMNCRVHVVEQQRSVPAVGQAIRVNQAGSSVTALRVLVFLDAAILFVGVLFSWRC